MLVTGKNFRANNNGLRVTIGPVEPSDDTPSVSHSLDSSLREGAGVGLYHSPHRPETATLRAIFIAPTKL